MAGHQSTVLDESAGVVHAVHGTDLRFVHGGANDAIQDVKGEVGEGDGGLRLGGWTKPSQCALRCISK